MVKKEYTLICNNHQCPMKDSEIKSSSPSGICSICRKPLRIKILDNNIASGAVIGTLIGAVAGGGVGAIIGLLTGSVIGAGISESERKRRGWLL